MKAATGHHWVTHAVVDVVLFAVLGLLLTKVKISAERLTGLLIGSVVIAGLIIAGFYLFVD